MSFKTQVEKYLRDQPLFRERKNKDRGTINLLLKMHSDIALAVSDGRIDKDDLVVFAQQYASMDRAWRQALEQNPDLRGSDYDDKDHLEHKKLQELGYQVAPLQP